MSGQVRKTHAVKAEEAKAKKAAPAPQKPTEAEIADAKIKAWQCECRKQAHEAEARAALRFKESKVGTRNLSPSSQAPIIDSDCREYLKKHNKEKNEGSGMMTNWEEVERQECNEAAKIGPIKKKPPADDGQGPSTSQDN